MSSPSSTNATLPDTSVSLPLLSDWKELMRDGIVASALVGATMTSTSVRARADASPESTSSISVIRHAAEAPRGLPPVNRDIEIPAEEWEAFLERVADPTPPDESILARYRGRGSRRS